MKKLEIKKGEKYGRLTVIQEVQPVVQKGIKKRVVRCSCECGKIKDLVIYNLRSGETKSCGCFNLELKIKHKKSKTPIYNSWENMKKRCLNPTNHNYKNYGGRGIKICDRWLASFTNFYQDMGDRPLGHTLDRIDNDGNYEPSNCKWSSTKEQLKNRRSYEKLPRYN